MSQSEEPKENQVAGFSLEAAGMAMSCTKQSDEKTPSSFYIQTMEIIKKVNEHVQTIKQHIVNQNSSSYHSQVHQSNEEEKLYSSSNQQSPPPAVSIKSSAQS